MKGFYYIENSVDEYRSRPSAFFESLDEAKEAIRYFADWYRPNGTGSIYFRQFGYKIQEKGYGIAHAPKFICRACGIDKETDRVIFSDKEF